LNKVEAKMAITDEISLELSRKTTTQARLLLDIDGTVCEYNFPLLIKNFFGVDISKYMIFAYDLADVLGVAPMLINAMFKDTVYGKPNFIEGALDTLKEWMDKGYELVIFSDRVKYMGELELVRWLIDNEIPFSGIDILGRGIYDFHVDDSPSKLMSTDSRIKLLFGQPWNKGCRNITRQLRRVETWQEIRKIVDERV